MRFNIAYLGPENLFHLRRDFIFSLKYSLEDLGHEVMLSGLALENNCVNLIIGAYFLPKDQIKKITESGLQYINVNTEVISNDMLNFNPAKVDLIGAYLPMIRNGISAWDVIADNLSEYDRYGIESNFLRWGYHPALRDIRHNDQKDLDFYFFGMISARRGAILEKLQAAGFRGAADHSCPYFLRNDRIARSKVQLNLVQDAKYTHVNSFRICYLANNDCHILSEMENDPAGYLKFTEIVDENNIVDKLGEAIVNNRWRDFGRHTSQEFEKITMKSIMESLLEETFRSQPTCRSLKVIA
ncbi:hypothetical protein MCEGEM3_02055 [Oxalobacteraceae bacterium]